MIIQDVSTLEPEIRLRLLATSDLHMQMTGFDYVARAPGTSSSFAKLATVIERARRDAERAQAVCLLFDNGDTFQGTPLADWLARQETNLPHPMVTAMKTLRYDACGLGNHDFDHGLTRLRQYLQQHGMPVICSNIASAYLPMVQPQCMLERTARGSDGRDHRLRIGVLSSLPDKTALWSKYHLEDRAALAAPLPVFQKAAARLRADGADLVIVLAHMGIALFDEGPEAQNQIQKVAALKEVDAVIGGHTHLRFPGPDHAGIQGVDAVKGTVHGKPVVQPGASGADLGVIDLCLRRPEAHARWEIVQSRVRLESPTRDTPPDDRIIQATQRVHACTVAYLSQPVAQLAAPMHSFFALAEPSALPALLAQAKLLTISEAVAGTEYADLPLLAASSAPLTGGLDGPGNFLFLDAGPLERRHIAGMNPYANNVWAVKTTGVQIIDWLERSAMIFTTLAADRPDQPLVDAHVPGFRYDAIYGLSYSVDPRRPPRFDLSGRINDTAEGPGRVLDVLWQGKPIDPLQEFLVATTDHRAGGGGLYKAFSNKDIVVRGGASLQEAVTTYFEAPDCSTVRSAKPWRFAPNLKRTAILLTAPEAADHLDEIAHMSPETCGLNDDGFLQVRLHL